MTKVQLIARAAGLGLEVEDKDSKERLMEKIVNHYNEIDDREAMVEFLDENGFALDDEGVIVKKTKRGSLGENPNTKAYHTIKVLQDESLAELSYTELARYLKETEGVETTSNSIAWYANWLKSKGRPVVARARKKKVEDPNPETNNEEPAGIPEDAPDAPDAEAEETPKEV